VTQATIAKTICVSGWTKTIRPPASYTNALKRSQLAEWHYADQNPSHYEEEHLISLEVDGAPWSKKNLWPEPHSESSKSDPRENVWHKQVCNGTLNLRAAAALNSSSHCARLDARFRGLRRARVKRVPLLVVLTTGLIFASTASAYTWSSTSGRPGKVHAYQVDAVGYGATGGATLTLQPPDVYRSSKARRFTQWICVVSRVILLSAYPGPTVAAKWPECLKVQRGQRFVGDTHVFQGTFDDVYRVKYEIGWYRLSGRRIGHAMAVYDEVGDYNCQTSYGCRLFQTVQGDEESYAIEFG
jgi:hypothetical protein